MRRCVQRSQPLGTASWVKTTARILGLESMLRARGRPRKQHKKRNWTCPTCPVFFSLLFQD